MLPGLVLSLRAVGTPLPKAGPELLFKRQGLASGTPRAHLVLYPIVAEIEPETNWVIAGVRHLEGGGLCEGV